MSATLLAAALALAAGCQDLLGLTPGTETGAGGGTTTTGGTGGATGGSTASGGGGATGGSTASGGAGGTTTTSTSVTDCSSCKPTDCMNATCESGKCVFTPEPATKIVALGIPGDCRADRCDGAGNVVTDVPEDTDYAVNECAWNACGGGVAGHLNRPDGTRCTDGVCENGLCTTATCVKNGKLDPPETDEDCGGPCDPCAPAKKCLIASDCQSALCIAGTCQPFTLLASTVVNGQLAFLTYHPDPVAAWTSTLDPTPMVGASHLSLGFQPDGRAVLVGRHGQPEAYSVRWTAGTWGDLTTWGVAAQGEAASNTWSTTAAATTEGFAFFVQNGNFQHKWATVPDQGSTNFTLLGDASSVFSGAAATRQGHVSFFHPDGSTSLVERRFLGGQWTPPTPLRDGNFSDAQPAAATHPDLGTLIVAIVRVGSDHYIDWVLLPDKAPPRSGTISGPKFTSPAAPPRRISVAARSDGGFALAYRASGNTPALWLADPAASGDLTWTDASASLGGPLISTDPAVVRGFDKATNATKLEVFWIAGSGNNALRHARLKSDGTWDSILTPTVNAASSVIAATP